MGFADAPPVPGGFSGVSGLRAPRRKTVAELAEALARGRARDRWKAADELGKQGSEAVVALPQLVAALSDSDQDVRCSVARALGNLGELAAQAAPELTRCLSDHDSGVRWGAAEALGKLGLSSAPAVDVLLEVLEDQEADVRSGAVCALGKLGQLGVGAPAAVPVIAEMLAHDEEWNVRRAAAEALARCGPASLPAMPALLKALKDKDPRVCSTAKKALDRVILGTIEPEQR